MWKIQVRNNGQMVDYDNRRFETRQEAKLAICHDENIHWSAKFDARAIKA